MSVGRSSKVVSTLSGPTESLNTPSLDVATKIPLLSHTTTLRWDGQAAILGPPLQGSGTKALRKDLTFSTSSLWKRSVRAQ